MMDFADSSFLASLYLRESTTKRAHAALQTSKRALAVTSLSLLELRNAFNRAVHLRRISPGQRDALWRDLESDIERGFLVPAALDSAAWHAQARDLSDRHTPVLGTRSLDLLHVAAALLLDAKLFFSFDERQRTVAASEGLKVKP
jgi:hypothetical protein